MNGIEYDLRHEPIKRITIHLVSGNKWIIDLTIADKVIWDRDTLTLTAFKNDEIVLRLPVVDEICVGMYD